MIVGISDTESPSLFVDESQVIYILSNGNAADDDYSFMEFGDDEGNEDVIKSGRVMDLVLAKNKIKIKKGDKPEAEFEAIINVIHEDEIEIGKSVNVKMGGHKLKVVGYYSSDDYDHFEVFTTATPEPDSAAAEYDEW